MDCRCPLLFLITYKFIKEIIMPTPLCRKIRLAILGLALLGTIPTFPLICSLIA